MLSPTARPRFSAMLPAIIAFTLLVVLVASDRDSDANQPPAT